MSKFLKRMLLVALLCVPWVTNAQTDTLTVADGTTTNSYIPVYGFYTDAVQHNQFIYPASMIAELVGDSITGMGFYMSSTNTSAWGITMTIRVGVTTATTLSQLDNSTSLTQLWQGTVDGQGDFWINFDDAYAYMGGNLLVDVQTTSGTYSSASFYGMSQSGTTAICNYYSNNYTQSFIPKTSFLHVEGDFDVCLMPTNLMADIDTNDITISWNPANDILGYNVYLNDSLVASSITDTFFNFSGLTANTLYTVSVASACANNESPSISATYRTACSLMQIPFYADFENDEYGVFPPCWTRTVAYGTDPSVNSVWSHSGSQSMYLQSDHQNTFFASQSVPLAGNNIKVDFWAYLKYYFYYYYGGLQRQWIQAGVMTNPYDTTTFTPLLYIDDMNSTWTHYQFSTHDLDANQTYYVAFKYYGEYPYNEGSGAIDDILITTTDGCAMPRRAMVDSVDVDFIELSWQPGCSSNSYEIAYGTSNDVADAIIITDISSTNYVLQNLKSNTNYYIWVRTMCNSGDTSLWMPFGRTRTLCGEYSPVPFEEDFSTLNSYTNDIPCWTFVLSQPGSSYDYPYVYVYNTTSYISFYPEYGADNIIAMPYFNLPANQINVEFDAYVGNSNGKLYVGYVTDLDDPDSFVAIDSVTSTTNTTYEINTSSVTADTIWIAFKATTTSQYAYAYLYRVSVNHLSNCQRPAYLVADSVSYDAAFLHCDNTGADSYVVRYATVNNIDVATALEISTSDTNFVLDNLTANTHYYTWVRAVCPGNDSSSWRTGVDFNTTCGEDFCLVDFDMHDSYGDGWNGHGFNLYMNGNYQRFITIDNGNSKTDHVAMCAGDTLLLTWTTGNYPGEVSFTISIGSVTLASAADANNLSSGQTIYTRVGCPTCFAPSNLAVDATMTTTESIDLHWTPFSEANDLWAVYVNGVYYGTANDTTFTISGLTANTGYEISVATICGEGDTSDFITINAGTACPGNECAVEVTLLDQYGYGWYYGGHLRVYQNGSLKANLTTDYDYGNHEFHNYVPVCEGDSLTLVGVFDGSSGSSYSSYTGYLVTTLLGDTLAYKAIGTVVEWQQVMTDTVSCPACMAPSTVNVTGITTTSANVSWQDFGVADSWLMIVSNGTNVSTIETTTPTFALTNLTPASQYTVSVKALCGADSSVFTTTTFVTDCNPITLPWDFAISSASAYIGGTYSSIPVCWYAPETYTSSNYVYPYYTTSYNGSLDIYGYNSNSMAATPLIPEAGNDLYVKFSTGYVYSSGSTITAGVIKDVTDPTTYIPIFTLPSNVTNQAEFEFLTNNVPGLSATDTVHIAFRVEVPGSGNGSFYLNHVYVRKLPNCERPENITVSNISDTSATITWDNTGASSYIVYYDNTSITVNTNSITLTGLQSGTTYNVDIQGVCATDSSIANHCQFNTLCVTKTLPYFESFENFNEYSQPNCWTMLNQYPDYSGNMSPYVYDYSYYAVTGTKVLYMAFPASGGTMAVSPALTGYPINTLYVSFHAYTGYAFEAGIMTDPTDPTTFTSLLTSNAGTYSMDQMSFQTNTVTSTESVYYVAFRALSNSYSGYIYIDDITVMQMPDCSQDFASVNVSEITGDSATVKWVDGIGINNGATHDVEVFANGQLVTTHTGVTSPFRMGGLSAETQYKVVVKTNCGGAVSAVSDTVTFMTICANAGVVYNYTDDMSTSTSTYGPIAYSYYNYSYTQTIIDSAYLASLEGDIISFGFLPTNVAAGASYFHNMTVYMANISESTFTDGFITPDADHVFVKVIDSADFCFTEADWQFHSFETPFTWDGHSNVLFAVNRENGTYASAPSFAAHSTNGYKMVYAYNDNNAYDINSPTASTAYTSSYSGDIQFISCGAGCTAPSALAVSDHDYQSVTVTWTGDAANYEVAYKALTDQAYPDATSITGNSYIIDNLYPGTDYVFRIRAVCDVDFVSDWVEFNFSTDELPCYAPTALQNTAVDLTTATFDWNVEGNETAWRLYVWNANTNLSFDVNAHPATATGLTQATTYYATVLAVCGGGILESETSDTVQFTTAACQPVTNVAVSNITTSSATVSWSGSAASYSIEYGMGDFEQGNGTQVDNITGTSYTIQGLTDDRNYSVYVRANCDGTNFSVWSDRVQFRTEAIIGIADVDGMNLTIYPNPTSDNTTIALSGVSGEVTITIVDLSGRTVKTDSMSCEGDCVKTIAVSGLAEGAYFVRVNGENVNMVKKLVVK